MDGVLWRGDTPMPGLNQFFDTLNAKEYGYALATNNASKTPQQYIEKYASFGVTVSEEHILTSALATADFLSQEYPQGTKAYVSGGPGIHQAMQNKGFDILPREAAKKGATAELVVVGLSFDTCYEDMSAAAIFINRGARFIGTNPDSSFPSEWGVLPGAGSLLALLETATGKTPLTIGKPEPHLFKAGLRRLNAQPENSAMIGDRLNTDIVGGTAVNLTTILVLSGITQPDELEHSPIQPDFIFQNITDLTKHLP